MKKSNPETIQAMFGEIAPRYDRANAFLSFNLHKKWNNELVRLTTIGSPDCLLDLCAGTGEIANLWLDRQPSPKKAILLDFCPEMLAIAEAKPKGKHDVTFIQGDAQAIPLSNASVDAVTVAYGIRNVKEPHRCFEETYRTLKTGGSFGILELTEPSNGFIRAGHNFYLKYILPRLGGWITNKPDAYRYLSSSIQAFVKPEELAVELTKAGFKEIQITPLTFGIAHLITCKK